MPATLSRRRVSIAHVAGALGPSSASWRESKLRALDVDEWERTMQKIWSRGLVLVLPSGERIEEFVLHVYRAERRD
jgi:hypothetical protein